MNAETSTRDYYSSCRERPSSHPVIQAFAEPKVEWILNNSQLKGSKVLEAGGGNGYFSHRLKDVCDLTVLDLSAHQLQYNPAPVKIVGSVYEIPFPDQSFDVVFCSNLLHHLEEPEKAVIEMARVAKKQVILSEPNRNNPLIFFGCMLNSAERNAIHYSKTYLSNMINNAGLTIRAYTHLGGLIMPNATPTFFLPFASAKSQHPLSFFQIFVCDK